MKTNLIIAAITILSISFTNGQNSTKDFYGMWSIDIEGGTVGWLEVDDENGYLDADLLWIGGSVSPVSNVYFIDDHNLIVTQTRKVQKSKEGENERTHIVTTTFKIKRKGDKISGVRIKPLPDGSGVSESKFTGWKLPDVGPAPNLATVKYGKPIELLNGKNLNGWKLLNPKNTNGFSIVDGVLVNNPVDVVGKKVHYGNLRTEKEFKDFNLKLEVKVPPHSNSGVYLRGMYEIQIRDSYGDDLDSHNMGALYSRITPSQAAEKPAGEWQTMDITLCDRHVTVILNGKTIIDNKPVYGPTGGAISPDVFKAGPIYLQGDHGKVFYRNIVLTPIIN
ncbi:MAG: DUF1080 domain-containing protein [Chlorobi bacterium]|nr:DUF1080 domain-containing protein [Chlorobiota bacterium]